MINYALVSDRGDRGLLQMDQDRLRVELETFNQLLPTLLPDEGKFAVVVGPKLVGTFSSYEDALKAGYDVAKLNPFLVKKISGVETTSYFTRPTGMTCHTSAS